MNRIGTAGIFFKVHCDIYDPQNHQSAYDLLSHLHSGS